MEELAAGLVAGLSRLKKGYLDSAESLLRIADPDQSYPYDFVVYRLTAYRRRHKAGSDAGEAMSGKDLRGDLQKLMLDLCDSFGLPASRYGETVYDVPALARHFSVSTKTIQRWRRGGLPTRKLVMPDGKKRLAFLESSVQWFAHSRRRQIERSARFSQMTESQRRDIIRRARRMVAFTQCTLAEVARRLARKTGRVAETIRYTIRKHDLEHPDEAVFPQMAVPLDEQEKTGIYRNFLRGTVVPELAQRFRRTRGSIYRIITEMRARGVLGRQIGYVYNPQFDLPNADELILSDKDVATATKEPVSHPVARPPPDLPPYLRSLYEVPLLDVQRERALFRRYNYLKYRADRLRQRIDPARARTGQIKAVETLLLQANAVKNQIIRANLRLVVSIAKKHVGGSQSLFELISDGNLSLMRAVEKFDYTRGTRFSTYASWAIIRNFARSIPRERYQMDHFATGQDEVLDIASSLKTYDPNEVNLSELRESLDVVLAQLTPLERSILVDHYGLDDEGKTRTLDQLGRRLGVSKERVRQIELAALRKLRGIRNPRETGLMR
jgi:RNA polymerase sigma factor (sigma-70 family)